MVQPSRDVKPDVPRDHGFRVIFAGNLGTAQSLETIVGAAVRLTADPDIRFVLVGSGGQRDWLLAEIEKRRLTNIDLLGQFPTEAMPGILAEASALLVTLKQGAALNQTIPSKIQTYLAVGRPIIACIDGEGARVIREAGAGLVCPAEDAGALASAIRRLKACSQEEILRMGNAGRLYFDSHFHPGMLAQQLRGHFHDAIDRAGR
jgi:glycosyltransferase involved in cell wall biosynthesis